MEKIFWCKTCLNMSTRPRISFDEKGSCNACNWRDEKKKLDWGARQIELKNLLDKYRSSDGKGFDCIVPVSGGKNGSYVAYILKHKYGLNPLTVTVRPPLSTELGVQNLSRFIEAGYNHIHISPDANIMQKLNKLGFVEKGLPYYGWLITIKTAVIQTAINFRIPLVFYGENGEVENGGSTESKNNPLYDIEYMKRVYFEGGYDKVFEKLLDREGVHEGDLALWKFPDDKQVSESKLKFAHWSYFENWDAYRNYVVVKKHCGFETKEERTTGTFTNFAQYDQALYSLHTYLMYLKFGFGRATQDAGIDIRRGAMTREQALKLVVAYDNHYPHEFVEIYLDYYKMTQKEFDEVLDKYVNKNLFEKIDGLWEPKFKVGEDFEI